MYAIQLLKLIKWAGVIIQNLVKFYKKCKIYHKIDFLWLLGHWRSHHNSGEKAQKNLPSFKEICQMVSFQKITREEKF